MPTVADLGAKVKAKYPGQYDDLDDASLGARVKAKYPTAYGDFTDTAQGSSAAPQVPTRAGGGIGGAITGALPGIGAGIGGTLGGILSGGPTLGLATIPGAMGGAALGGGLGEMARETLTGDYQPMGVVNEAGKQSLLELAGHGVGKIPATIGGTITGRIIRQRAAITRQLYAEAGKQGMTYQPKELIAGIGDLYTELAETSPKAAGTLKKMVRDFMSNKPSDASPLRIQRIKQLADQQAKLVFDAQRKRVPVSQVQNLRARLMSLVGNNAREMLRRIPGAEAAESVTRMAIKAGRGVPTEREGPVNVAARMSAAGGLGASIGGLANGAPGAATGALSALLLTNPWLLKHLIGPLLDNPAAQVGARQIPRAVDAMVER